MTAIRPSDCTISDHIAMVYDLTQVIDDCLLLGEKVTMISDAGEVYNHLRSLITPPYLTDEEYAWLKNIANAWNNETLEYNRQMQGTITDEQQDNLDDLQDEIKRALDELMDGCFGDDEQFDLE